ncbi:MAG TPA: ion channel [Candidatus Binataceae bacterium]
MARRDRIQGNANSDGDEEQLLADLYHYFLTASWPMLLLIVAALFAVVNLFFALGYFLDGGIENARPGSFLDCFFFSVQTMATIGYGKMSPATTAANVLVSFEALFGLVGLALVTGLVFSKFARPSAKVRFSRYAVVSTRDGVPCLMFRMANLRGNQIVEASIRISIARTEVTAEGESMRRVRDLELARDHQPLFALSWTVFHPIVEGSQLFGETAASLARSAPDFILSITGFDQTFAQTIYARHVYHLDDIKWDARFVDVLVIAADGRPSVDYSHFDDVVAFTPTRDLS